MSSRRNHKQRQETHTTNNDNEIYTIGTMMAGTDRSLEDSISGYTPVIVDRRGNRRFHGAFTGGFNAGYFNTVGSVQGYKPKYDSWTSSRNNRSTQSIAQTPMDYMDEEDMATNTNLLTTSKQFNSLNTKSMDMCRKNKSNVSRHFGDKMSNYLTVNNSGVSNHTKGIQLLKKCGWRSGKNIGDKSNIVRLKLLLKKQDMLLLNNTAANDNVNTLFGEHILSSKENDDTVSDTKFVSIYRPKMKTDSHGLGYGYDADNEDNSEEFHISSKHSGFKRSNSANDTTQTFAPLKKKRKLTSSARHGLSALEETEIGDDVYCDDMGSSIEYNAFIANVSDNDDDIVLLKARDYKSQKHKQTKPKKVRREKDERLRARDGTLPIPGFEVASMADNYQYTLKQQIRSANKNRNRHNFQSGFSGYKQFKSNKMEIDQEFVGKFSNFELTVGSFMCRGVNGGRRSKSKVLSAGANIPGFIPNAQQIKKEKKRLSQHLTDNFTEAETLTADHEHMNGLRAGLTLAAHIPGKDSNIRKANELLAEIRSVYGNQNAEKLLRFDVFLADKLGIESPIEGETSHSVLFDDGNKTQFELNQEKSEFEERWSELQKYSEFLYSDKARIHRRKSAETDVGYIKKEQKTNKMSAKEAAKLNLYGPLTRSTELWIPDRLLCKRCNIRDPYEGMYNKPKNTQRQRGPLFGGLLLEEKNRNNIKSAETHVIQSRGEQIAEMLQRTGSDKQPPILQLKQLKTWNAYLNESGETNKSAKVRMERNSEMQSFMDGILNDDSDMSEGGDTEGSVRGLAKDCAETKTKKEFSLFKSIFENDGDIDEESESESESESSEESNDKVMETKEITATMPPLQMSANKQRKESVINEESVKESESVRVQRKKFKFVAKSDRKSNVSMSRFGHGMSDGNVKQSLSMKQTQFQLQLSHGSDDDICEVNQASEKEIKSELTVENAKKEMVWTIVDNESNSSDESESVNEKIERRKKKKKKRKSKDKKSKKKKSKHRKRSKSKKKHR